MKTKLHSLFFMLAYLAGALQTTAQGTAFTYQGQLSTSGGFANGNYDFAFSVFTTNTGGLSVVGPLTNTATPVSAGLFTVTLDFGAGVFTGSSNWLDISVRTNGAGAFTELTPRQQLTPTPYAIFAGTANSVSGVVGLAQLPPTVITNDSASLTVGGSNTIAPLTVPPNQPPAAVGSVSLGGNSSPAFVVVAGNYAYVVNAGSNTLQVFDVSNPSLPASVGIATTGPGPQCVAVAGRYAYAANYNAGLQVFDVSDPAAPVSVASVAAGISPLFVCVAGRYAYVLNRGDTGGGKLQIFDVSNPSAPVSVGAATTGLAANSLAVDGRYAYVVTDPGSNPGLLQIFDLSNPANPALAGSLTGLNQAFSVAVAGRYAYVANAGSSKLQVFDVSNPAAPSSVSLVGTGNSAFAVAVAGRYAYVATAGNGLQIFDVSNPSAPVGLGSAGTAATALAVAGRYAYLLSPSAGTMQIFDLGGAYLQQLEAGAMETGTLQTRATATVGNNLDVRGGLTVSASARISGGLSVDGGTIVGPSFSGNGGGLTNLSAPSLSGSVPVAALTSVPAANLTGTIPPISLPAAVVTNTETGVTLSGTFSGSGGGLTGLNGSQLLSGVVPPGVLPGFQSASNYNTVSGGQQNTNTGKWAAIGGGQINLINGNGIYGTVAGGYENGATAYAGTVGGGQNNTAAGENSIVGGGVLNQALGNGSVISGGGFDGNNVGNVARGLASVIAGGIGNTNNGNYASIPGGYQNLASGTNSFAAGSYAQATNGGSFVWSDASSSTPFGSAKNNSFNVRATGGLNFATSGAGMTLDGALTLNAGTPIIYGYGGEILMYVDGFQTSYAGNAGNVTTSGQYNTGFGAGALRISSSGQYNTAVGNEALQQNSTGSQNTALGANSFFALSTGFNNIGIGYAAGYNLTIGSNNIYIGNLAPGNESGIIRIGTQGTQTACYLAGTVYANGTFVSSSDRNAKENFKAVDAREVLEKVAAMPVTRWNYKEDAATEHLGPMAQDFYAAFNVGPDDRHIATIDESGVALAAIQGLNQKLNEKDVEIQSLKRQNDALAERLNALEASVNQLATHR
jgi:hypothetical protein